MNNMEIESTILGRAYQLFFFFVYFLIFQHYSRVFMLKLSDGLSIFAVLQIKFKSYFDHILLCCSINS